ncbi:MULTISPECIES: glycosyltransferase family 2 protein [unclassified Treponema]|uniref:glycosyltransferase family 2 protein n=1 Tax=unclassified Treponema TaxID=2638727 RepID=UPI000530140F|nr:MULTISPECIES: glycosyltransferase family 2 protein [unclassified Treponema]AIW88718.1 glycosyl transferase [Treponema sp. OMZ 838]UTC51281.1 glycosyltransferase family 2 protein [Treponema sp. OMZ 855]
MTFRQRCAVRFGRAAQHKPLVSLCVPVYGTEGLVGRFLDTVLQQADAPLVETIIVNDGSPGTKELRSIVKIYAKRFNAQGLPFVFLEHGKNLGLVEARRTAVNAASGEYIAFADSDDELPPKALHILYDAACASGADIVHGKAAVFGTEGEPEARVAVFVRRAQNVYEGVLHGDAIMHGFLIKRLYSDFLWGKLFKTNLVQKAYAAIPFTYCTMAEDVLTYFFIALYADKYRGIPDIVYNYCINTGVTSRKEISDLAEWEKVCSAASVFTIILSYLDDHPSIGSEIRKAVKALGRTYRTDNLKQLEACVTPVLQEEARAMLDEWWGIGVRN